MFKRVEFNFKRLKPVKKFRNYHTNLERVELLYWGVVCLKTPFYSV